MKMQVRGNRYDTLSTSIERWLGKRQKGGLNKEAPFLGIKAPETAVKTLKPSQISESKGFLANLTGKAKERSIYLVYLPKI